MTEPTPARYTARVEIPADHPCFPGHFPGQPILPGVLLLERVMALARASLARPLSECTVYNVKFLAPVAPGETLDLQLASSQANEYKFTVRLAPAGDGQGADGIIACSGLLRTGPP